jgi:hypothetical protein
LLGYILGHHAPTGNSFLSGSRLLEPMKAKLCEPEEQVWYDVRRTLVQKGTFNLRKNKPHFIFYFKNHKDTCCRRPFKGWQSQPLVKVGYSQSIKVQQGFQ